MNRSFFIFVVFMCFIIKGYAQVSFGVKGGLNLNNQHIKNKNSVVDNAMSLGFNVGFYLSKPIGKGFTFAPEVQYSLKGSKLRYATGASNTYTEWDTEKLSYLDFPIVFAYNITKILYAEAGPSLGFLLSDRLGKEALDAGFLAGFKVSINTKMAVQTRYYFGLTETQKIFFSDGPTSASKEINFYNRTIQFGLTYKIK